MSYISAVSSEESRSMRVAMLEAMTFCGGTVGPFIGGALLGATGSHAIVFLVIMAMYVLVILYVIFLVPSVKDDRVADDQLLLTSENCCKKLFSCNHFQSSLQTCFKPRPNNRRRNLLLLIACALITMTVTAGENLRSRNITERARLPNNDNFFLPRWNGRCIPLHKRWTPCVELRNIQLLLRIKIRCWRAFTYRTIPGGPTIKLTRGNHLLHRSCFKSGWSSSTWFRHNHTHDVLCTFRFYVQHFLLTVYSFAALQTSWAQRAR